MYSVSSQGITNLVLEINVMEEGELPADYDTTLEWPGEELACSQAEYAYDNSYSLDPPKIKAENILFCGSWFSRHLSSLASNS